MYYTLRDRAGSRKGTHIHDFVRDIGTNSSVDCAGGMFGIVELFGGNFEFFWTRFIWVGVELPEGRYLIRIKFKREILKKEY